MKRERSRRMVGYHCGIFFLPSCSTVYLDRGKVGNNLNSVKTNSAGFGEFIFSLASV